MGGDLPPISVAVYLVELLFEIGPVQPMPMASPVAIGELEIAAWQSNQHLRLAAWESAAIRKLSREYAYALSQASEASCPPYYVSPERLDAQHRAQIGKAMSNWADKVNNKTRALQK